MPLTLKFVSLGKGLGILMKHRKHSDIRITITSKLQGIKNLQFHSMWLGWVGGSHTI